MVRQYVVGVGSPHGDDQVGWQLVDLLAQVPLPGARFVVTGNPADLLNWMRDCQSLVIVDACQRGDGPGTMTRLRWPFPVELLTAAGPPRSTHGMSVSTALALAERLAILPPCVDLFVIEVQACAPGTPLSAELQRCLPELVSRVRHDLERTEVSCCQVSARQLSS